LFFGNTLPTNFDEAQALAENGVYPKIFHGLLSGGVALAPGAYEALFPSLSHTDAIIDQTLEILAQAAADIN
jgi:glutamate-1-semialdehyde 2,1-aminomutase